MGQFLRAETRRVERREHLGKPAIVTIVIQTYDTTPSDLWGAVTNPKRLARWFAPVEGDLRLGGRYRIEGNASGTITGCEIGKFFELTWEVGGGTSWVRAKVEHLKQYAEKSRLTLEHISPSDGVGEEHLRRFGPGAVGVGWDLSLLGLSQTLADPSTRVEAADFEIWCASEDGKAFIRKSGEAWGTADVAGGESSSEALAKSKRTIAFFTGS